MLPPFYETLFAAFAFILGACIGSFLNVCIYRMPLGLSVNEPKRSFCPSCKYQIPLYHNIPLVTWLVLRGKCANCGGRISFRYFGVELLTGLLFLAVWLRVWAWGAPGWPLQAWVLALPYWIMVALFIAATFIDFEHFIIPDEITIGGMVVGFLCSFAVPALHGEKVAFRALEKSFLGIVVGGGLIYLILRLGKLLFGKQNLDLPPNTRVVFSETALILPDKEIPYEDLFYRKTDVITLDAKTVELVDRCYRASRIRLSPAKLQIDEEEFNPEETPHLEVVTDTLSLPREAMGFGDVKFMAAIGAFLGWQATIFSLMVSSVIGALVGVCLILLKKQEWSSRLPYGPYIALAATLWIFGGKGLLAWWLAGGGFSF